MPEPFYLFYFGLIIVAAVFSGVAYYKGDKKSFFLLILLISTLLFEILMLVWEKHGTKRHLFFIDVFASAEYLLFCMYALNTCERNKIKTWIKLSIMLFVLFSLVASYLVSTYGKQYFGLITWNINVEGFLLFIIYTYALFNISDEVPLPIYRQPDFWVAIGVLIFYGGVFVMLGLYPVLIKIDPAAAGFDYSIILRPLNVILYLCMIGGSVCFITNRKYLIQ